MHSNLPFEKFYRPRAVSLKRKPLRYLICGKPLITSEPRIRKFQILAEMILNYHTNKKNTHRDFPDNFYNIKNFVQVGRIEKIINNS
jgi:hypothetical protein